MSLNGDGHDDDNHGDNGDGDCVLNRISVKWYIDIWGTGFPVRFTTFR